MIATTLRFSGEKNEGEQRADASRRKRGKNGDGMDEALIEHAKNDVYRDQRSENQQRLVGEGILESSSGALEAGLHAGEESSTPSAAC